MQTENQATAAVLGAVAICPLNAKVNTNVQLKGQHSYSIKNTTANEITVELIFELKDSNGHSISNNDFVSIGAGATANGTEDTFLLTNYSTTGSKTVTATTKVTGAISQSASGNCSFQVIP